jgi:hypothetical protein
MTASTPHGGRRAGAGRKNGVQNAHRTESPPLEGFKVATRLSEAGSTKAYAALLSLI